MKERDVCVGDYLKKRKMTLREAVTEADKRALTLNEFLGIDEINKRMPFLWTPHREGGKKDE